MLFYPSCKVAWRLASVTENNTSTTGENTTGIRYFKLPFVGDFSTVARNKLKRMWDVFCKDIDIRIVLSSFKIKNFFSFKDPIPDALRWLETVSSTYILIGRYNHSLSLDATIMVSKNCPTIGEHVVIIFVTQ